MKIEKPVFIIGTGRSGSTMFHDIISYHEQLSWFSVLLSKFPKKIIWNRFYMQIRTIPLIGNILRTKLIPTETYNFWETHVKGFSRPFRDLYAQDVSAKIKQNIPVLFAKNLSRKRTRLLVKITGWPRIGFINEIFPDALFIHIKRDPRATVNSFLNVDFWQGWEGPHNWRFGMLNEQEDKIMKSHDQSFAALASIGWIKMTEALYKAVEEIPKERFLELSYTDICNDPLKEFRKVYDFADLKESKKIQKVLKKKKIINKNDKWQKELNEGQKQILNDILKPYIENSTA
jgi:hypothetical protein